MTVDLPYPPSALRPNAASPGAWRRKQTAAKAYRADCMILCRAQGLGKADMDRAHLTLRFCAPDARRRDLDNDLASAKQAIDAVAEMIGIDDHLFGFTLVRGEVVKGGRLTITVGEA